MRFGRLWVLLLALLGTTVVTATPSTALPAPVRIAGADRYETAAAVSRYSFHPGVSVAFVVVGETYPDALAAAPAAGRARGPLLLVRRSSIPPATAAELDRLDPKSIVVIGGIGAIDFELERALASYTSGQVVRVGGGDRYSTATSISRNFPADARIAYIANGVGFADGVIGGAAGAHRGGPVLLVPPDHVPPTVITELQRLRPAVLVVLGGPAAVSPAVESQLAPYAGRVVRRGGPNRYATAVALSMFTYEPGVLRLFLVTGEAFADALAAGPGAAPLGGAVLPVRRDCIPPLVRAEIDRLDPASIIVLGGEGVVSSAVANLVTCPGPSDPPPDPITFGDGTHYVNTGVLSGTYRTRLDSPGCSWTRLGLTSGTFGEASGFSDFHSVVTILDHDDRFRSDGCGTWTSDLSPLTTSPTAPFGSGDWIVGTDIAAGTWTSPGGPGCYWLRLGGFSGTFSEQLEIGQDQPDPVVTITPTDRGFRTGRCGTWSRVG